MTQSGPPQSLALVSRIACVLYGGGKVKRPRSGNMAAACAVLSLARTAVLTAGSMKPPGKDGAAVTAPVGGSREASSAKENALGPKAHRPTASAVARTRRTQARRMRLAGAADDPLGRAP